MGGFKSISKLAKKAASGVKKAAKAVNKMAGGKLGQFVANKGCPLAVKAFAKGVKYAMTAGLGVPPQLAGVPPCILKKMERECKKQIMKLFKRHRAARRLGLVQGEMTW